MLEAGVVSDGGATVWEATGNLAPALATALWAYVAGLFDAPDLPALRSAALDVRRVIPGTVAHFREADLAGSAVITLSDVPQAATAPLIAAYRQLRHEHPLISHADHPGGGRLPVAISDVADEDAFAATALYQEVYRGIGMRDQLVIPVPVRRGRATVTLSVGRDGWGFSEPERVAAQIIQRSLRVTYGSMWRRRSHHAAAGVSTELLARSGIHVCVVDRFGEVSDAAPAVRLDPLVAEAISGAGRLAGTTGARTAQGSGQHTGEEHHVLVELKVTDSRGAPVTLQVLHSDDGEFWPVMLQGASSNVCLERLLERGLTRRQAEVMELLLAGRTTSEAALDLGISPRTAEKHIQLACVTLGARTRSEALVALASGAGSRS